MATKDFYKIAFNALVDSSPDMVFFKDENFVYMGGSKAFSDMAGVASHSDVIGKTDFDLFPKEIALNFRNDDTQLLKSGVAMIDKVEPITEQGGQKRFSLTSKYVLYDEHGNVAGLYGLGRDISSHIELRTEREMREVSQKMFGEILEADLDANKMLSAEGEYWAKEIAEHENISYESSLALIAKKFLHPDCISEFNHKFSISNLMADISKGVNKFTYLTHHHIGNESYRWVELTSHLHFSKITNTMHITTFLRDLDDEIRKNEELRVIAETDGLTGLLNRKSIIEQISAFLSTENESKTHALLFLDIDKFKLVNDTFGHRAGDDVLTSISSRIETIFRKTDLVGRLGGDEFLVLLKNIDSKAVAEKLVDNLLSTSPLTYKDEANTMTVTCSIGISMYSPNKDFEQMYGEADKAMYKAKQNGGNCLAFY